MDSLHTIFIKKGLEPSLKSDNNWWATESGNWNQVCNAGMAYGALAVYDENQELAKQVVQLVRERRRLESDLDEIDIAEGLELRNALEGLTDCEIQVQTGQFKPLTGSDFCKVWDSGILFGCSNKIKY